jgi:hypothetical protein
VIPARNLASGSALSAAASATYLYHIHFWISLSARLIRSFGNCTRIHTHFRLDLSIFYRP